MLRTFLWVAILAGALLAAAFPVEGEPNVSGSLQDLARERADDHLRQQAAALGLREDLTDLRLLEVREGLSAVHVRYQKTFQGIPVFGGTVTVSVPKRDDLQPTILSRYHPGTTPASTVASIGRQEAINIAKGAINPQGSPILRGQATTEQIYAPYGDAYVLAWQVIVPTLEPLGTWLLHIRADDGGVLLKENVLRFDSARVFDPNPAKTSPSIPPPSECDTSAQEASVAGQYRNRELPNITSGQNQLKGAYVDLTAPGILGAYKPAGLADEPTRTYVYPCTDDRFEEAMIYFHVDYTQRKIQSLGFTGQAGIYDRPIPAHAHYFADCNAFYDPASQGIHFGDSDLGVCNAIGSPPDTAEDADVIVHEYGHAIQQDQVPGWGFGKFSTAFQALSMGEGFGDFLPGAIYGDECVGEWVSLGANACGGGEGLRNLENGAVYDAVLDEVINLPSWCSSASDVHCSGLVWGGALWDLVQALPGGVTQTNRDLVLQLVLDSHFYLDPQATFAEAAGAIRAADTALYDGSHLTTIDSVFTLRGTTLVDPVDFPYANINIRHPYVGDLDVNIKVGSQSTPVCTINITERDLTAASPDLIGFVVLDSSACGRLLPPTDDQPWWLEVRDGFYVDQGTIEDFQIVLSGTQRCLATDTPIVIPDGPDDPGPDGQPYTDDDPFGPYVYSQVDCTTQNGPPSLGVDSDGDTIPDVIDPDDDDDSLGLTDTSELIFRDAVELFVGTNQKVGCNATSVPNDEVDDTWPPDFNDDQIVNIFDVLALAPPVFFSVDGDAAYSRRFDLDMNGIINVFDVNRLAPPLFFSSCVP